MTSKQGDLGGIARLLQPQEQVKQDWGIFRPRTAYIVTYNLKALGIFYKALYDELQRSITWWHFLDSTWIIVRFEPLDDLAKILTPLVYDNDYLLIMPAKGPAQGLLPPEAWQWIRQHVPAG